MRMASTYAVLMSNTTRTKDADKVMDRLARMLDLPGWDYSAEQKQEWLTALRPKLDQCSPAELRRYVKRPLDALALVKK